MKKIFILILFLIGVLQLQAEVKASIVGGVVNPGEYVLKDGEGVFNLIVMAGGLEQGCGGNKLTIRREKTVNGTKHYGIEIDTLGIIEQKQDIKLENGDVVSISVCVGLGLSGLWDDELTTYNQKIEKYASSKGRTFIEIYKSDPVDGGQ